MRLSSMRVAAGGIGLDQVLDVGERVEQEVRLDLRLHELQLRLEDVLLELVALGLGLGDARLVARVLLAQDDRRPPPRSRSRSRAPC